MNIAVIMIDTLRYDYVGANGNAWIKTPNLDRFAAEAWVFDQSYAASYPTIPYRTDALTGRYGAPLHAWRPLRYDLPTLPRALADLGYATQLIHDNPHLVNGGHNFDWPFHAWSMIRGTEVDRPWITDSLDWPENWKLDPLFDRFGEPPDVATQPFWATYVRANRNRKTDADWNAAQLFATANAFLRDNARRDNFFLWVDCFDPHEPWEAPAAYMQVYDDTPGYDGSIDPRIFTTKHATIPEACAKRIRAAYAANVSWADHQVGTFLDTLEETGLAKQTVVIIAADHGTNQGEWGVFGKTWPVREHEAHVPMMIRVPDGGSGRCDTIVQPQDLFATVTGIAGGATPDDIESFDILAAAREGTRTPRQLALSGSAADNWAENPQNTFSVFDGEWYLLMAPDIADCHLHHMGSQDEVAADNPGIVEQLRKAALVELAHRGADPALVDWFRSGGSAPFPADVPLWDGWPGPAGFDLYWNHLYRDARPAGS